MHTPTFQNFMVWRKSQQKKLWTNWICFNPDLGKLTKYGWWDLKIISVDACTQFTLTQLKEECQTRGVCLTLAAPEHQEMKGQVEVTWRTLRTVSHYLMVYARVPEVCVHFALIYTTDHIFSFLISKYIINKDGYPKTPHN